MPMNSIKKKLFLQIGSLIVLLIGLLILANTFLLKPFYIQKQKKQLLKHYDVINAIDVDGYSASYDVLSDIENKSHVTIIIKDNTGVLYSTKFNFLDDTLIEPKLTPPPPKPYVIVQEKPINQQINWVWSEDERKTRFLQIVGTLDNGNRIKISMPLMAINHSIDLANQFTLIIGILLFVIGMFIAYVLSQHFTKPILDMNRTTTALKHLHFGTACQVRSKDELGQLAQSINDMSIELRDTIHSLNHSNNELQKEVKQRIKIDEKRKQLLSNVSHELKTPIALLQGYAEGLKLNVAKNHNRTDFYCDVIVDEANKMNQLVQALLSVNQIEFGDIKIHETDFDIVDLVHYIVDKYHQHFEDHHLHVSFLPLNQPIGVHTDRLKMEQVLTNYINNAIQYVDDQKMIKIRMVDSEHHVRIEVYNSCTSIPEEELDKLWDSFYKLDKARTRALGGHGLGLSIVKAIQEALGNGYGVELNPNGICFWFEVAKCTEDL